MNRAWMILVLLAFAWLVACQKKDTSALNTQSSQQALLFSSKLSYGDSIFYFSATGPGRNIFPVSKPDQPGLFFASSAGLDLDTLTGKINIGKSETGLRYSIYYVSLDRQPLDSVNILLSGIDYKDSIYDLSDSLTNEQIALPIYNMDQSAPLPCSNGNGSVNANGCKFDETDINGDGVDDIPGANKNKMIVDVTNGRINVKESYLAGVFGTNPQNGKKKDVTMYYRLNEGGVRTLNRITVTLVYFKSRAYVPDSMIKEVASRNERYDVLHSQQQQTLEESTMLLSYSLTLSKPKRPPLIVIVSGR